MNATTTAQYQIRYNRTTNHISGIEVRTAGSEMNYSLTSCPVLSRTYNLANGQSSDDLAALLVSAKTGRKICRHCEKAAEAAIEIIEAAAAAAAPKTAHADCTHAATKTERAKCRKARAAK